MQKYLVIFFLILFSCCFSSGKLFAQKTPATVEQAEKNIEKKRESRKKAQQKAEKDGKKRFMGIQSKETQKRMKKQQKALKKRDKRKKKRRK